MDQRFLERNCNSHDTIFQNMVATYIGVALYITLFFDYMTYERFCEGNTTRFVLSSEVDLGSDAVWEPGQGDQIRAQDQKDSETKESQ